MTITLINKDAQPARIYVLLIRPSVRIPNIHSVWLFDHEVQSSAY